MPLLPRCERSQSDAWKILLRLRVDVIVAYSPHKAKVQCNSVARYHFQVSPRATKDVERISNPRYAGSSPVGDASNLMVSRALRPVGEGTPDLVNQTPCLCR